MVRDTTRERATCAYAYSLRPLVYEVKLVLLSLLYLRSNTYLEIDL